MNQYDATNARMVHSRISKSVGKGSCRNVKQKANYDVRFGLQFVHRINIQGEKGRATATKHGADRAINSQACRT